MEKMLRNNKRVMRIIFQHLMRVRDGEEGSDA